MRAIWVMVLCLLAWTAAAGDEPQPMSYDDLEAAEAPAAPARKAIIDKRRVTIDFAEELLVGETNPLQRATLTLRLAHLLHEQGRDTHDADLLRRATTLYASIPQQDPSFPVMDHVRFFLGFALMSLHEDDRGQVELTAVVRDHPTSTYGPHAWLHLGESWFRRDDYAAASEAYRNASRAHDFPFRTFAAYKLAWCAWRDHRPDLAIQVMTAAVLEADSEVLAAAALEALQHWANSLGRSLDPRLRDGASGGAHHGPTPDLDSLARREQCALIRPESAQQLQDAPLAPEAPRHQLAIVQCLVEEGRPGEARAEVARMEALFGHKSAWWLANPDRHGSARQHLKDARKLAR